MARYLFFPEIGVRDLCKLLGRLGTYHYNKRKFIVLGKEKSLYNKLIENSFNPFTVYRWALLERAPDDIKFQLKYANDEISLEDYRVKLEVLQRTESLFL